MTAPRRHGPSRAALLAVSLLTWPATALAGHPLTTDDAGTVDRGALEVEASAVVTRPTEPDSDGMAGVGLALHLGLLDRVDIGGGLFYEATLENGQWTSTMADPTLDAKVRLVDGDGEALPGLALRLDYRAPSTHHDDHHTGHDAGGVLIASWEPGIATLDLNLGAYAVGLATGESAAMLYASTACLFEVIPTLRVGVEGVLEGHGPASIEAATVMTAAVWESEHAALSLGLGATWAQEGRPGFIGTLGVTSSFGGPDPASE